MFGRRRELGHTPRTKIEKRVSSLPTYELVPWAEQILNTLSRNVSAWNRDNHPFYLEDSQKNVEALTAIIKILGERTNERRL